MPLSQKCDRSDFVVDNSASLPETRVQVERIVTYLQSSRQYIRVRVFLLVLLLVVVFTLAGLFVLISKLVA